MTKIPEHFERMREHLALLPHELIVWSKEVELFIRWKARVARLNDQFPRPKEPRPHVRRLPVPAGPEPKAVFMDHSEAIALQREWLTGRAKSVPAGRRSKYTLILAKYFKLADALAEREVELRHRVDQSIELARECGNALGKEQGPLADRWSTRLIGDLMQLRSWWPDDWFPKGTTVVSVDRTGRVVCERSVEEDRPMPTSFDIVDEHHSASLANLVARLRDRLKELNDIRAAYFHGASAAAERWSPEMSLEDFAEALLMSTLRFKDEAEAEWDLQEVSRQRWRVNYAKMSPDKIDRIERYAMKLAVKRRAGKRRRAERAREIAKKE